MCIHSPSEGPWSTLPSRRAHDRHVGESANELLTLLITSTRMPPLSHVHRRVLVGDIDPLDLLVGHVKDDPIALAEELQTARDDGDLINYGQNTRFCARPCRNGVL
jgi:hypothetical protein